MQRVSRHPTLARSVLVRDFLTSTQWTIAMHKQVAAPGSGAEGHTSVLDNMTDTFINAFTKVRKPDERFLELKEGLEKFEDGMAGVERLISKDRSRTEDLAQDYVDLAASYQGLGYLESGITEPLNRFAERMLDFSTHLKDFDANHVEPFLSHIHSLGQYSQSHRGIIKLRDQKQLDFEELSAYLSAVVSERDRLAALNNGHSNAPVGLTTYLRDQVDKIRGTDDIHTRRERMRKLDGKIKELQDAVTGAHETSTEFSDEVLKEHNIFELSKQEEMKEMLGSYAQGQIDMYKKVGQDTLVNLPLSFSFLFVVVDILGRRLFPAPFSFPGHSISFLSVWQTLWFFGPHTTTDVADNLRFYFLTVPQAIDDWDSIIPILKRIRVEV